MSMSVSIRSNKNPFGFIFVLALFLIVVISLYSLFSVQFSSTTSVASSVSFIEYESVMTVEEIRIFEILSGHAWIQHGDEVNQAFKCLKNNGTIKSFKTTGFMSNGNKIPTNLWLCQDGEDFYAIISTYFEKIGANNVAKLVTAYKVSKDVFPSIDDYLSYIKSDWGAFEISYNIAKGAEILLSPK